MKASLWSPGHNPGMVEQQNNVLDAALAAGVKYLVRVGGGRAVAKADSESVVGRGHAAIEHRLKSSDIGWVILRPGLFMQNVLGQAASIKNDSKMVLPFAAELPVALIDVRDTGAVGARILLDPAPHVGKTYEFTGKLTTYRDLTALFSSALGRPITYVGITPEQAEQGMKSRGMPDWLIAHMVTIAKIGAGRRLLDRRHQGDRGCGRTRADHDQTIRRGFQAGVRLTTRIVWIYRKCFARLPPSRHARACPAHPDHRGSVPVQAGWPGQARP